MVSCHTFRLLSIVLTLLGLVDCEGCWIGVVLQPFGQRCRRPFLASFQIYHIAGHIHFLIIQESISLSVFGLSVQFLGLSQEFGV